MKQSKLLFVSLAGLLAVFLSGPLAADTTTTTAFARAGYALPGGVIDKSSPTLADLDGDGKPEVLIGTTSLNGTNYQYDRPAVLVAMKGNGSIQWKKTLDAPMNSAPAVGDINNDGHPEVVVSVGGDVADIHKPGGVIAFDRFGNQLWRFRTVDFSPRDGFGEGVYGSPTLCDVDGDGYKEIAFGAWDQRIYLLDHNGNSLWNNMPNDSVGQGFWNVDTVWSTAACADLNEDGSAEIIIGADITGGGRLPDGQPSQDGGFLYIFDRFGNMLVRRFLPESIYSAPAVGDLDGNGRLEIVVGTSWYWWNAHSRSEQPYVYAFDTTRVFGGRHYSDADKLPYLSGWPQATIYPGFSSPALADLDNNGDLEIVIGTGHPDLANDGILGAGQVYAWHHDGRLVDGWPISPRNVRNDDAAIFSSPTIADVDADGQLEILFTMIWDVQVYNADGTFQQYLTGAWTMWGSPAIGDTDGDNRLDVWIGGGNYENAASGYLWHFESSQSGQGRLPWPMFQQNPQHTGVVPGEPEAALSTDRLYLLHTLQDKQAQHSFSLSNLGRVPLNWSVSPRAATNSTTGPTAITVSPVSGELDPRETLRLTVNVDLTQFQAGRHDLGTVRVEANGPDGTPASGFPADVALELYIGDIQQLYLPKLAR